MSTIELTEQTFNDTVADNDIVLLDFWAEWCGPCRMFGPVYEKVSADYPQAVFGKIDTEAQPGLGAAFNISSIPTLMIIRDGIVLFEQAGALPESNLRELVKQAVALDMEKVRADIAAAQAGDAEIDERSA